jgi:hypothetical protein
MPGYGLLPPGDGTGLLPWSWAERRLETSHSYWLATTRPDHRPHVMPLWGIWIDASFAFSTGRLSVKARNLRTNPWCVVVTEDPAEPVIVEGMARLVDDARVLRRICDAYAAKYGAAPQEPTEGPLYLLTPVRAFGLIEQAEEFTGSATRWTFPESTRPLPPHP